MLASFSDRLFSVPSTALDLPLTSVVTPGGGELSIAKKLDRSPGADSHQAITVLCLSLNQLFWLWSWRWFLVGLGHVLTLSPRGLCQSYLNYMHEQWEKDCSPKENADVVSSKGGWMPTGRNNGLCLQPAKNIRKECIGNKKSWCLFLALPLTGWKTVINFTHHLWVSSPISVKGARPGVWC